jgi:hypothetical protein
MFLSVPSALFCEKDEKFAFPPGKTGNWTAGWPAARFQDCFPAAAFLIPPAKNLSILPV